MKDGKNFPEANMDMAISPNYRESPLTFLFPPHRRGTPPHQ
jgi:hypothetical protein